MITRRSLFASLAGLAVAPAVADEAYKTATIGLDFGARMPARIKAGSRVVITLSGVIFDDADFTSVERLNLSRPQRDKGAE